MRGRLPIVGGESGKDDNVGNETQEGGKRDQPPAGKAKKPDESREDRVAAALRANLRRRKAQARGRKGATEPPSSTS